MKASCPWLLKIGGEIARKGVAIAVAVDVVVGEGVLVGTAVSTKLLVAVGVLLGGGVAVADGRSTETVTTSANEACGVGSMVGVQAVRTAVASPKIKNMVL